MTAAPREPYAPRWLLLVAVSMSAFITGLDNTILNIALSALQNDMDLSLSGLQWVGTSYILAFSSLLMVGGRLNDLLGRRVVLQLGMGIFTAASVFAGIAPSPTLLIIARVLQGVGGALVLPSTFAVLQADLDEKDHHLGVGVWTASIAIAIALGPIIGGGIIQVAHWSWIFFINLPVGVIAILLVRRTVRPERIDSLAPKVDPDGRVVGPTLIQRFDLPGLFTSSLALMSFTFVLVHGQEHGFGATPVVVAIVLGVVMTAAFIRTEKTTSFPLVELSLFSNRIFAGGTVAQVIWGLGINGILFFTSLFLQDVLRLEPFDAGLFYAPLAIAIGLFVPVAAKMAERYGANVTVAVGMVLISIGMLLGVFVQADDPAVKFLIGLILVGIGSGLTTPMTSAVMDVIPQDNAGGGAAVISTAREISGVIGIALIGAVLVIRRSAALDDGVDPTQAFVSGYHVALVFATFVMLAGAVVSYLTLTTRQQAIDMAAARAADAGAGHPAEHPLEATTAADGAIAAGELYAELSPRVTPPRPPV